MSSFEADKKKEHINKSKKAMDKNKNSRAFYHLLKAADFSLDIAEMNEGEIAKRNIKDAEDLRKIAEDLVDKINNEDKEKKEKKDKVNKYEKNQDKDKTDNDWSLTEKPPERLADVAGLNEVKKELKEKVIEPFNHPDVYDRFKLQAGGGILMYGPPGTGKTFISRAIAGELDAEFFYVDAANVKNKYYGETEKNIKKLFNEARKYERSVIFLDEAENLLGKRGNRKSNSVNIFLGSADGLVQNDNCMLLLGATNRPWMMDEAAIRPGRMGTLIYVGLPDRDAREEILRLKLKEVPISDEVFFTEIAEKTEGYSGADLEEICIQAKLSAKNRQINNKKDEEVSNEDFSYALEKVNVSVTKEQLKKFEKWKKNRENN